MPADPTLHLRLDPSVRHDLDALTRRLNLSRSAVIRLALRRLAQAEGIPEPEGEELGGAAA